MEDGYHIAIRTNSTLTAGVGRQISKFSSQELKLMSLETAIRAVERSFSEEKRCSKELNLALST